MAQQNRFLYLQTENKQPFYIKIENKLYSSTAAGYLIIPKLIDGSYILKLGFPKNEWAEQNLQININKKDAGFLIKNFGEKGWGLFSWQTMDVLMASNKVNEVTPLETNVKTKDTLTTTKKVFEAPLNIETVVHQKDTPITYKQANEVTSIETTAKAKGTLTPPDKVIEVINIETAVSKKDTAIINNSIEKTPQPVVKKDVTPIFDRKNNGIVKVLSVWSSEGTELQYIDYTGISPDTIRILIPKEKTVLVVPNPANNIPAQKSNSETKSIPATNGNAGNEEVKFEAEKNLSQTSTQKINANAEKDGVKETATTKVILPNSDCKAIATEDDFLKLRKKMAAEENDDDMVGVARKIFKIKCFTTEHIKNLCVLFLSDQGKYKFFDAAYPFVSDSYNFINLQPQLTDNYFINRFKSMLRQ